MIFLNPAKGLQLAIGQSECKIADGNLTQLETLRKSEGGECRRFFFSEVVPAQQFIALARVQNMASVT